MKVFQRNSNIFNLLSESVSEGIIVVNSKHVIVATNSSAEKMFGYEKNELIGKTINALIPKKYHHSHDFQVENFIENGVKREMISEGNLYGLRKDGEEFPLETGLNPFELFGSVYVMALVTDITERKNYTEKLERTVEERTKQLTEALAKEKELSELKTRFLSLVSHEFKTPLSSILTSITLLGKYTQTDQQQKRDKHVTSIQNNVKYLDTILNDFLSVERLQAGKVNYKIEEFPLNIVINEVIYNSNMLLKEGQKIRYPEHIDDMIIRFDEKTLVLALSNLIHNAIKYSPEHSIIDVKVEKKEDEFLLKIIDEGMGIPDADQKHIFNRYFRAENALLTQGTGIGLNIAKQHLENLGATLEFDSKENSGSTFKIQIPDLFIPT